MRDIDSVYFNTVEKIDSIQVHIEDIRHELTDSTSFVIESLKISRGEYDEVSFWITFATVILGIFTLLFTYLTYRSQKRTEKNTDKISVVVQKSQLLDMIRHLYRNLICTIAMADEYFEQSNNSSTFCYPSEEHLLKLKFLPEDIMHTETFVNNERVIQAMHKFKLLVRNYDIEVDVALKHIKNQKVDREVVEHDFDTLALKCVLFVNEILTIMEEINATSRTYRRETRNKLTQKALGIFLQSHINTVKTKINDKRIQWDKYEFHDYASSSDSAIANQVNRLLKDLKHIDRAELMEQITIDAETQKYIAGDYKYYNLSRQTRNLSLCNILSKDSIDTYELLSLIISIDSSIERSIIKTITLKN